jgi:MFS transporter, NHS family, xanthosine permease
MSSTLRIRLFIMMFLQYAVPACTLPILSYYLKGSLDFAPWQAGVVMAMPAVAAFFALPAASHFADRFLSSERMLALCHFCCAGLMLLLHELQSFPAVLAIYFLYGIAFTPTFGLSNTAALHHTPDARRDFGGIRMWGTIGWCVIAWAFGYFWLRGSGTAGARVHHALYLSAALSAAMGLFCLGFRPALARGGAGSRIRYGAVLRVFARPDMLLLLAATFINNTCHQFYYFGMGPYLNQMGFSDEHIMPAMSLGQMTEIVLLGLLGAILLRISMKTALIIGVLAQALRCLLFSLEGSLPVILGGVALHGPCYALYFTTAYLYVDRHSAPSTRAGAQQVLTIMIAGPGTLAGFVLAGYTAQFFEDAAGIIDYGRFWLVPVGISLLLAVLLVAGLRETRPLKEAGGSGTSSPNAR